MTNRDEQLRYFRCDQYRDSRNLDARAELHRRFTVSAEEAWQRWVFTRLDLRPGERLLECGSGPGWLWRENLDRLPAGCYITLTDLSPGMIAEAQAALKEYPGFAFREANVEALPFADESFDVIVANHMLYHLPDLERGLAEIRRVLKPGGRFFAATNGERHMAELHDLARQFLPQLPGGLGDILSVGPRAALSFRLENGRDYLSSYFSWIDLHRYESRLAVTEAEPLLAYIASSSELQQMLRGDLRDKARQYLERQIAAQGAIHITKDAGMFAARK